MSPESDDPKLVELDDLPGLLLPGETVGTASGSLKPLRVRIVSRLPVASNAWPGVVFTVEAGSEVSVFAFNSPEDRDPDLVVVPPGTVSSEAGTSGQLRLTGGACWLKVKHEGGVKAESGLPLAGGRLRLDGTAPVAFSDYRRHERSEGAARAVADDLFHPRFALLLSDVVALRPEEAIAFEASGTLRAVADVSWSDVLANGLGTLAGIVGAASPLSLQLSAAAAVRATVGVADRFTVVFSRLPDGRTRVAVKKSASRTLGAGVDLGLAVELSDPQQLEQGLHDAVAGLLGQGYATVRALVDKASLSELSELERNAAEALAARLGLGDIVKCFTILRAKLRQLEGALAEGIAELATAKLATGFAYEYDRIARGSTVLQVVLSAEALAVHHASLCSGDLEPVIAAVRERAPGVTLESYLRRRTLDRTHAWGFTLGIGPWAASGRQRRELTRIVEQDLAGRCRVSCVGLGAYEGRWLADVAEWTVDLRAGMHRFAAGPAPVAAEFELGLHLAWHWRQQRLEAHELDGVLDTAALWGVFEKGQAAELRDRIAPTLGRAAELTVQMRLDDGPLRAVLPLVAAGRDADFAAALGAAMPWRAGSAGRGDPDRRRDLYGALWAHVLDHPDTPARALVALAREQLAASAEPQLSFLEDNYLRLTPTCTFVGLARVANQNTAAAWGDFRVGARLLTDALAAAGEEDGTFEKVFSLMATLWLQSHHVRALGAFLLELASAAGVAAAVVRTLTVVIRDEGGERALVVAAPAT